jgi:transglutaminase-like putative cysteine protease
MYSQAVSICHTEVHLSPRQGARQAVLDHLLTITPQPDFSVSRSDYFGNDVTYFSIHEPHQTLTIVASNLVDVSAAVFPDWDSSPPWEQVRDEIRRRSTPEAFDAVQFAFESPRVTLGRPFAAYAAECFTPGRPVLSAVAGLSQRIFTEFVYDDRATTVTTPVEEVLRARHGVCQDFAHLMIACLRSLGLPARYISGYLRSGDDFVGAQASHAWVAVYSPGLGWFDFDPTNNVMPQDGHITLAWGRDYSDVTPVKGIALGGGDQIINASVEVVPEPAPA